MKRLPRDLPTKDILNDLLEELPEEEASLYERPNEIALNEPAPTPRPHPQKAETPCKLQKRRIIYKQPRRQNLPALATPRSSSSFALFMYPAYSPLNQRSKITIDNHVYSLGETVSEKYNLRWINLNSEKTQALLPRHKRDYLFQKILGRVTKSL